MLLKDEVFNAGGEFIGQAEEFVGKAVGIDTVAVSLDGNDFAQDLIRFDRLVAGSGGVAAESENERCA